MERAFSARTPRTTASSLGVRTTGIFCRPSCPARKPKPENVEFFAMPKEALFAGYRPCLGASPLDGRRRAAAWVTQLLARIESEPDGARRASATCARMGVEPGARAPLLRGSATA